MVHVETLALTAGAEVVVTAHQALEAGSVYGAIAAVTLDARVEGGLSAGVRLGLLLLLCPGVPLLLGLLLWSLRVALWSTGGSGDGRTWPYRGKYQQ